MQAPRNGCGARRFPAEYVLEFQKCLDRTEPVPWEVVRRTIAADLGVPLEQAFASIDPVPLATASVAQVHAAGAPAACPPAGRASVVHAGTASLLHAGMGVNNGRAPSAYGHAAALTQRVLPWKAAERLCLHGSPAASQWRACCARPE